MSFIAVPCAGVGGKNLNRMNLQSIATALHIRGYASATKRKLCEAINSTTNLGDTLTIAAELKRMGFEVNWKIESVDMNDKQTNPEGKEFVKVKWSDGARETYEPIENVSQYGTVLVPDLEDHISPWIDDLVLQTARNNRLDADVIANLPSRAYIEVCSANFDFGALRKDKMFLISGKKETGEFYGALDLHNIFSSEDIYVDVNYGEYIINGDGKYLKATLLQNDYQTKLLQRNNISRRYVRLDDQTYDWRSDGTMWLLDAHNNDVGRVQIPNQLRVIEVCNGNGYILMLLSNGSVQGIGNQNMHEISKIPGNVQFKTIDSRAGYCCGISVQGKIFEWGGVHQMYPSAPGRGTFTKLSVSETSAVAITSEGKIVQWGNFKKEGSHNYYLPPLLTGGEKYNAVSHGYKTVIAITNRGRIITWGEIDGNSYHLPIGLLGPVFTLNIESTKERFERVLPKLGNYISAIREIFGAAESDNSQKIRNIQDQYLETLQTSKTTDLEKLTRMIIEFSNRYLNVQSSQTLGQAPAFPPKENWQCKNETDYYGEDENVNDIPAKDFIRLRSVCWNMNQLVQQIRAVNGRNENPADPEYVAQLRANPANRPPIPKLWDTDKEKHDIVTHPGNAQRTILPMLDQIRGAHISIPESLASELFCKIGSILWARGKPFEERVTEVLTPTELEEWNRLKGGLQRFEMPWVYNDSMTDAEKERWKEIFNNRVKQPAFQRMGEIWRSLSLDQQNSVLTVLGKSRFGMESCVRGSECVMIFGESFVKACNEWAEVNGKPQYRIPIKSS